MRAYTALHYQAQVCAGNTVLVLDLAVLLYSWPDSRVLR